MDFSSASRSRTLGFAKHWHFPVKKMPLQFAAVNTEILKGVAKELGPHLEGVPSTWVWPWLKAENYPVYITCSSNQYGNPHGAENYPVYHLVVIINPPRAEIYPVYHLVVILNPPRAENYPVFHLVLTNNPPRAENYPVFHLVITNNPPRA
jgi:hypothetical protein